MKFKTTAGRKGDQIQTLPLCKKEYQEESFRQQPIHSSTGPSNNGSSGPSSKGSPTNTKALESLKLELSALKFEANLKDEYS